jgi:hypothetical protein
MASADDLRERVEFLQQLVLGLHDRVAEDRRRVDLVNQQAAQARRSAM